VRLLLESRLPTATIAAATKLTLRTVQEYARNHRMFGTVSPPTLRSSHRNRLSVPAQEGILDFLFEYDKLAAVEEVRILVKECGKPQARRRFVGRLSARAL
jgi:hypothetical protein